MTDPIAPHVARTTKAKPDRCRDCGQPPVVSAVHHPRAGRKLGKTHQQVLVFCKGDPKAATAACGEVDVTWPDADDA